MELPNLLETPCKKWKFRSRNQQIKFQPDSFPLDWVKTTTPRSWIKSLRQAMNKVISFTSPKKVAIWLKALKLHWSKLLNLLKGWVKTDLNWLFQLQISLNPKHWNSSGIRTFQSTTKAWTKQCVVAWLISSANTIKKLRISTTIFGTVKH